MSVSVPVVPITKAKQTFYLRAGAMAVGEGSVWYKKTGEWRAPKKGELYLADPNPVVYEAHRDLPAEFWIVTEAPSPAYTVTVGGFVYKLRGPAK